MARALLQGGMVRAARLLSAAVIVASSLACIAGCNGQVAGQDLITPNPDPTNPGPDPGPDPDPQPIGCPTIAPACDPGSTQYSSDAACKNAGNDYCYTRSVSCQGRVTASIVCGSGRSQCDGYPVCDEGDTQTSGCPKTTNARCYDRTTCGTTIMCVHYEPTCGAVPVCDVGDTQVGSTSSPLCTAPGYSCYSRTVCGTTIACAKKN